MRQFAIAVLLLAVTIRLYGQTGPLGSTQRVPPGDRTSAVTQQVPAYVLYRFFFLHLANLNQVAAKVEKAGDKEGAAALRNHEQHAAGLSEEKAAIVNQVASECNQAVAEEDAKIKAAIAAFQAQYPRGQYLKVQPPAGLLDLQQQRIQIIQSHIDRLHSQLGEESFQRLDAHVQKRFGASIKRQPPGQKSSQVTTTSSNVSGGGQ